MSTSSSSSKSEPDNSAWGAARSQTPSNSVWETGSDKGSEANAKALANGTTTSGGSGVGIMSGSVSSSVGGWGDNLSDGQFNGNSSSGAPSLTDGDGVSGAGEVSSFGSAMWQGIRNISSLSNIDSKDVTPPQVSSWDDQSAAPGIPSDLSKAGSTIKQGNPMSKWDQGGSNPPGAGGVWGSTSSDPNSGFDAKSEHSGWGSPCPSPINNAGTEGWGAPDPRKVQSQASWGQTSTAGNWDQADRLSQNTTSTSWDSTRSTSSASTWGESSKPELSTGWAPPPETSRPAPPAWGTSTESKPSSTSPGQAQWVSSSGASGPQPQWSASSASQAQPPSSSQMGAWGSGNPITTRPPQPPVRPLGVQGPPQPPHVPEQPTQPVQQPSSWAEAAGRGLPSKPSPVGTTNRKISKEEIINQTINSTDSWGKTPVRQDASWDQVDESPKLPPKPSLSSTGSSGSQEDLHWNQPNNGTAIWESAKEATPSAAPPPSMNTWERNSGAAGSSNEWGANSDNDGGTWSGGGTPTPGHAHPSMAQHQPSQPLHYPGPPHSQPHGPPPPPPPQPHAPPHLQHQHSQPHADSNVWQGPPNQANWNQPPKPTNVWGGNDDRPSSGSSGSNDSKKNWQPQQSGGTQGKSDNVWDVNGTSLWGDPEKTETGTWTAGGERGRRNSSTGSWESDNGGNSWNNRREEIRGGAGGYDNQGGTAYWGNPEKGNWQNNHPAAVATHMPPPLPQAITGRAPTDKPPLWNQSQPPKPSWDASPPGGRDEMMWNQGNKPNNGWQDAGGQWQRQKSQPGWSESVDWNGAANSRKPPQRSRMLQQLMDMGFKKEDAQNALIRSDMDLDRAISDLVATSKRSDIDIDQRGRQLKGMGSSEDLVDATCEPTPFLPPPNTPASAQGLHAQVITSPYTKTPSLQNISSQNTSINPLPPKLPPQLAKPPVPPQTQPIRPHLPNQTQQMIQAQIVQQLQMAVSAGLISPQLLNQHLTPAMLIMLQQLLQLQQVYQQLVTQQQVLQQNTSMPPLHHRAQLEQIALTIAKVKQKIALAQQSLAKQASSQQAQPPPAGMDPNKELLKDLQELQLKDAAAAQQVQQQQSQQSQIQSRLQQWKLPSPDKQEGMKQGAANLWPSTSTTTTKSAAVSPSDTKTATSTKGLKDGDDSDGGARDAAGNPSLEIEEFVPGKPWQGMIAKSIEDDPTLTPENASTNMNWSIGGSPAVTAAGSVNPSLATKSTWSSTPTESTSSMFLAGDIWGMSAGGASSKNRRPPPGLMNRSVSCPGGPSAPWSSNWLILKNLPPQVDGSSVKNLCNQHGPLTMFLHSAQFGQAYVCYKTREDATKAQKALGSLHLGSSSIMVEFANEEDVSRLQEMSAVSHGNPSGQWAQQPPPTSGHAGIRPPFSGGKFEHAGQLNGAANFSGGNMWNAGGLWGSADDHQDMLPGNLLGGH